MQIVKDFVKQLRRLPEAEQDRHLEEVLIARIEVLEQAPGRTTTFEERQQLVAELAKANDARNGCHAAALRSATERAAEQVIAAEHVLKAAKVQRASAEYELGMFNLNLDTEVSGIRRRLLLSAHPAIERLLLDLRSARLHALGAYREQQWKPPGTSSLLQPHIFSNAESIEKTRQALQQLEERADALQYEAMPQEALLACVADLRNELRLLPHVGSLPTDRAARATAPAS
jgi:hypothetical protein